MGIEVEKYFGNPQDIEFAFDDKGDIYIVQSRDITTLFPIDALVQDDKLRPYLGAGTVMLGMKEPFTPLGGFDIMSHMFPTIINVMTARKKKLLTNNFVKHAGYRMYVDMSYLMASKFVAKQFANAFSGNDLPLKGVMYNVIDTYGKRFRRQGIRFRMPLGFFKYGIRMAGKVGKINKIPVEGRYEAMRNVGDELFDLQKKGYENLSTDEDRIAFAGDVLVEAFKLSQTQSMYCLELNNLPKIEKALKKYFGETYRPEVLIQSLDGCVTQSMMLDLNNYAKYLDENNLEVDPKDEAFSKILRTYGHRGSTELDMGTNRWNEDPSYLLGLATSYRIDKMYNRNLQDHEEKRVEAEAMIEEVYDELKAIKGEKTAKKLKKLMVNYRHSAAMREYPKSDIVRFMELGRKALKQVATRLVDEGKLEEVDDIFFLYKSEILSEGDLKALVSSHKEFYQKEMTRTSIPRMILNNGATYYSSTAIDKNSKTLQGLPLSPGSYEGVIRVVFNPNDTELQEGEIMVTESTNPAWTPLFATAGALIMEYGGPMSHGGIVAREYGIPAVVGIPSATDVLRDGQRVRIDGESGVIELID